MQAFAGFVRCRARVVHRLAHRRGAQLLPPGFISNGAYAAGWRHFDRRPLAAHRRGARPAVRRGHDLAPAPRTVCGLSTDHVDLGRHVRHRLAVQIYLYLQDDVFWLGIARFVMGLPLYLSVVGLAYWMIRRAPPPHPATEGRRASRRAASLRPKAALPLRVRTEGLLHPVL